jgi:hypothetical protein
MDLWEYMGWGDEPLDYVQESEMFCGVKKSQMVEWMNQNPPPPFNNPTQGVVVWDGDRQVEIECPLPTQSLFTHFSICVISIDYVRNVLLVGYGGIKPHGFTDAVLRDAHYMTVREYRYEVEVREEHLRNIPWETLSLMDKVCALRCIVMTGGVVKSTMVEAIDYYFGVRSDFTGEMPRSLPPKIMKVER